MKKMLIVIVATLAFCCVDIAGAYAGTPTVKTDKEKYYVGDQVRVTLTNTSKESIFSHVASKTPPVSIQMIEQKTKRGDWEKWDAQCKPPFCQTDWDAPAEISGGKSASFSWNPVIYISGTPRSYQAKEGAYRLIITYQDKKGRAWLTVTTNEFTIE